ncbi:hypothetical protein [Microvirga sp. VF16]|uniref:hypothetical protein n=1 Tax=Microvirga sp. VF16 TaxID=2807101 RepID=UPI00193D4B03|nr:hypothetical protein [Microvirga sp. VF16]QRM27670.1 hypothetical protein JO965_15465 [Microvirga sp. VF16]
MPSSFPSFRPGRTSAKAWLHGILLILGLIALGAGLCGAWWRLGLSLPYGSSLAEIHGPLMISGLFGALISLERAVALRRPWTYAAPILSGSGTLALFFGAPVEFGAGLYTAASVALAGSSLLITVHQPALFTGTLLFGALAWLAGNSLCLMGQSVPDVTGWWLAFLILTIAGERLELSRLMPQRRGSEALFLFSIGLLAVGSHNGLPSPNGAVLFGVALLATALWLLRHDIARLNVRRTGQVRFMAICMLAGYPWLAVAGLVLIVIPPTNGFAYDVVLHAVLIGFVLSMVFGHALIILPAIVRIRLRYASALYVPLLLLHASVILRVGGGLIGWEAGRMGSAILTLVALMAFVGSLAFARWRNKGSFAPIGSEPLPPPSVPSHANVGRVP